MDLCSQNSMKQGDDNASITRRRAKLNIPLYISTSFAHSPDYYLILPEYKDYVAKVYIPHGMINDRLKKVAFLIHQHYLNLPGDVMIIALMKGAALVMNDLLVHLNELRSSTSLDSSSGGSQRDGSFLKFYYNEYLRCSSYVNTVSASDCMFGSELTRILNDSRGHHVLIVDDLIDSGKTLSQVCRLFADGGVLSVRTFVACCKRTPLWNEFQVDWAGFEIDDVFIIGYGADYNQRFRDLKHICLFDKSSIQKFTV